MKCPNCNNEMERVTDGNGNYWYQCKHCGKEIGKSVPEAKTS